jgi:hypothetical protein
MDDHSKSKAHEISGNLGSKNSTLPSLKNAVKGIIKRNSIINAFSAQTRLRKVSESASVTDASPIIIAINSTPNDDILDSCNFEKNEIKDNAPDTSFDLNENLCAVMSDNVQSSSVSPEIKELKSELAHIKSHLKICCATLRTIAQEYTLKENAEKFKPFLDSNEISIEVVYQLIIAIKDVIFEVKVKNKSLSEEIALLRDEHLRTTENLLGENKNLKYQISQLEHQLAELKLKCTNQSLRYLPMYIFFVQILQLISPRKIVLRKKKEISKAR